MNKRTVLDNCLICSKPFKHINNRQKVCKECKHKMDAINAKFRKAKQRYIQKHGKDACCGRCVDCIQTNCCNWWSYWYGELDRRELEYKDKHNHLMSKEEQNEILKQLLHDIQNVYTEEEKMEIIPWEKLYKLKRFN